MLPYFLQNMRKFSPIEQRTIRNLVNHANGNLSYVLANAYNDIFYQRHVKYSKGKLIFYQEDVNTLNDVDDILSIEKEIIDISFLLDYLIKNRYINVIEDPSSANPLNEIGGFLADGLTPIEKSIDSSVAKILENALNHRVFISEDLIQLVNNDFKTVEEMSLDEARKQTKYSRKSVCYAFFAVIISIIMPIISTLLLSPTVKLDSRQFDQLYNCCSNKESDIDLTYQQQIDTVREVLYIDTCINH